MTSSLTHLGVPPVTDEVVSQLAAVEIAGAASRDGEDLLNMEKKPDSFWRLGVEEVSLCRVQNHVTEFVPSIALCGDAFADGYRDIAAVRFLRDIEG